MVLQKLMEDSKARRVGRGDQLQLEVNEEGLRAEEEVKSRSIGRGERKSNKDHGEWREEAITELHSS